MHGDSSLEARNLVEGRGGRCRGGCYVLVFSYFVDTVCWYLFDDGSFSFCLTFLVNVISVAANAVTHVGGGATTSVFWVEKILLTFEAIRK